MLKGRKNMLVKQMKGVLDNSSVIFVAHVNGLKIRDEQDIRDSLSDIGLQMKHVKNTLAQQALADTRLQNLAPVFNGPVVLLHSDEPESAKKLIGKLDKDFSDIHVVGGAFMGTLFANSDLKKIADIPSEEQLRINLVQTVQSPINHLIGVKLIGSLTHSSKQMLKCLTKPGNDMTRALDVHRENLAEA